MKSSNLSQCIISEVFLQNCKGYIGIVSKSPSQDNVEFENFLSEFASSNSLFTIILRGFNRTSSSWWKKDKTTEGTYLEALTSLHNFEELLSEPTHILSHFCSCIDLIFTNQPNLVVNWGTNSTLNTKYHDQMTHCILNLNIEYPPPYGQLVWDNKKPNTESIKKSIELVNLKTCLTTKLSTNKFLLLMKLELIFSHFFPTNLLHLIIVTLLR